MAIADQGSLSSAVGVLNVARAALSSAISFAPWRRVGTQLLHRSAQGVKPTEAG
ncbi:LysR family transcriptional regulator [Xanthobacter autotrophicus]|uniref:LysR family transcriptional regulator n=1 Tax=Xanthobacter autotrophicus TaxID=280 RepID=A0A6C1KKH8_XANAU|nr:LysR family transcriptional regulator [Xanthobacter autotrophicus]